MHFFGCPNSTGLRSVNFDKFDLTIYKRSEIKSAKRSFAARNIKIYLEICEIRPVTLKQRGKRRLDRDEF